MADETRWHGSDCRASRGRHSRSAKEAIRDRSRQPLVDERNVFDRECSGRNHVCARRGDGPVVDRNLNVGRISAHIEAVAALERVVRRTGREKVRLYPTMGADDAGLAPRGRPPIRSVANRAASTAGLFGTANAKALTFGEFAFPASVFVSEGCPP